MKNLFSHSKSVSNFEKAIALVHRFYEYQAAHASEAPVIPSEAAHKPAQG